MRVLYRENEESLLTLAHTPANPNPRWCCTRVAPTQADPGVPRAAHTQQMRPLQIKPPQPKPSPHWADRTAPHVKVPAPTPGLHSATVAPRMHWMLPAHTCFLHDDSSCAAARRAQEQHTAAATAAAATPHQQQTSRHGRRTYTHTPQQQQQQDSRLPYCHCVCVQNREPRVAVQGHLSTSQGPGTCSQPLPAAQTRAAACETGRGMYTTQRKQHPTNISWSQNRTTDGRAVTHTRPALYCAEPCSSAAPYSPRADQWHSTAQGAELATAGRRGSPGAECSAVHTAHAGQ